MEYTKDKATELLTGYKRKEIVEKRHPNGLLLHIPNSRKQVIDWLAKELTKELGTLPDDVPDTVYSNMVHLLDYRIIVEYTEYNNSKLAKENNKIKNAFKVFRDMLKEEK